MSIIIYGSAGSGKSKHKYALANHFGLSLIIEEWKTGDELPDDTLALTNVPDIDGAINFNEVASALNLF